MALTEAARRQCYSDSGQHHRQQRRQPKKALRPLKGGAYLRAPVTCIFNSLTPAKAGFQPLLKCGDCLDIASHQQPVGNAATYLNQPGRLKVGHVHQKPGSHAEEIDTPIRLKRQNCRHLQVDPANRQRIARIQGQCRCQALVAPEFAGRRHPGGLRVGRIECGCGTQASTQWVGTADGLDLHQLRTLGKLHHARERSRLGRPQATRLRLLLHRDRQGVIGNQQQISTKQLVCFALQRLTHSIGKEADRRQRSNGHHHGGGKQAQFTRAGVPPEQTKCD